MRTQVPMRARTPLSLKAGQLSNGMGGSAALAWVAAWRRAGSRWSARGRVSGED
jgi:hypothetical protein